MNAVLDRYGDFVEMVYDRVEQMIATNAQPVLKYHAVRHLKTMRTSKGVRPALVAAGYRHYFWDVPGRPYSPQSIDYAAAVQLIHEATLIVDDIIDDSAVRRGAPSLQAVVGKLTAGATAAELNMIAMELVDDSARARRLMRNAGRAIARAETIQERDRGVDLPYSFTRWLEIARGDTGALFDLAAGLGGADAEPAPQWLTALGLLRHGLDDVSDILEPDGDQADVRDNIPTLLAVHAKGWGEFNLKQAVPAALKDINRFLAEPRPPEFDCFFADFEETARSLSRCAL